MSTNEKEDIVIVESAPPILTHVVENAQHIERRLVRKLDMRLLPTVFIIFVMNYIDVLSLFLHPSRGSLTMLCSETPSRPLD